jgi:Beta-lactamase
MANEWDAEAVKKGVHGVTVDAADLYAYLDSRAAGGPLLVPREHRRVPPPVVRKLHPPFGWRLDVSAFMTAVERALTNQCAGYVLELRQNGAQIASQAWHYAINGSAEGQRVSPPVVLPSLDWGTGIRMHIASCSKTITAIALTKLLNQRDMPYDAPIYPWLPQYWQQGDNVKLITFADLMTHRSGLDSTDTSTGPADYESAMAAYQAGVPTTAVGGTPQYKNMNYTLGRILIATLNGNIDPTTTIGVKTLPGFDFLNNVLWDVATYDAYALYVQENIFAPAGVNGPTMTRPPGCALAYTFPVSGPGWNSGDLTLVAGAAGWHMSVEELLDIMGTFRRAGTIMTTAQAQTMLDDLFGIDPNGYYSTKAGPVYAKNGEGVGPANQLEQCAAYFLPEDMELVVFVNSPVGMDNKWLEGLVEGLYADNLIFL